MDTPQQVLENIASANPVAKAELDRMKTELKQAYADRAQTNGAMFRVCEAADAVLTNEEHAFSGGMRSYKKGSPTWEAYDNLLQATQLAYQTRSVTPRANTVPKLPTAFLEQLQVLMDPRNDRPRG